MPPIEKVVTVLAAITAQAKAVIMLAVTNKLDEVIANKRISPVLGFGIFFMPYFFVWILLKNGYSNKAKAIGFSWLILTLVYVFYIGQKNDHNSQIAQSQQSDSNNQAVEPRANG